ncbi:beta-ketoacyl-ACP synthase III [Rhodococcus sp. SBT000017]|uniref:beta-ketoacyl-ACP synthase 3 n=1 Tax=Rhodococcus sp. SBT000017 TaxID=1803385 RepID=UPI000EF86CEE|nr:beta-ketoacyl-ACP synthase 3 [Rhodococcus sp. SBT000017]RMB78134.1 beta-ketoacyl-ACP synthase III [Rhodococcus sp. SBT000017]
MCATAAQEHRWSAPLHTGSVGARTVVEFRGVRIVGIGGFVPGAPVHNHQLCTDLDTSDEWITQRTGIRSRHFVGPGVTTSDMATAAAANALDSARREFEPDIVVCATTTPDFRCPATAPVVASNLGLTSRPAFDVSAVCSGFLYALSVAGSMLGEGKYDSALVVAAESFSTLLDKRDRSTAVIFGDGAGAVLLRYDPDALSGQVHGVELASEGTDSQLISVPGGGAYSAAHPDEALSPYFRMDGRRVFTRAIRAMADISLRALEVPGWTVGQVDTLIGHQANARILRGVANELGIPAHKAVVHLDEVGNTSAASIPLAMAARGKSIATSSKTLLTAYGAGTTWAAATLDWPDVTPVYTSDLCPTNLSNGAMT